MQELQCLNAEVGILFLIQLVSFLIRSRILHVLMPEVAFCF